MRHLYDHLIRLRNFTGRLGTMNIVGKMIENGLDMLNEEDQERDS